MAVTAARVSVATTATRLDTGTVGGMSRSALLVRNAGAATVDLGGSTVTSGAGFELAAGESASIDVVFGDGGVYGIAAAGTVSCHVLQVGS